MITRFFRLEGNDGLGIYHSVCENNISPWDNVTKNSRHMLQQDNIHVIPSLDKKLGLTFDCIEDESYFFGFLDIDQYKAWLYNPVWRHKLGDYGINLCVYEIDSRKLKKSEHQVAFRREDAILVEVLNPFHFH
jgi:hypothetical protein